MKRVGNLWPRIVSLENLYDAARAAAKGKRKRPDVARFLLNLEPEVVKLQQELESGGYTPGAYRTLQIHDPKPRLISAAPFRDRVVHHALTRVIEPVFEPRFTKDSYACRRGYGTHKALEAARKLARRFPFVLKLDVRKYFASIDHEILKAQLARVIKCRSTLRLAAAIIDGSNPQEEVREYFPGDTLFTPDERRRGLPLGNQTSQFFANVYLNPLDHFAWEVLRPGGYVRYVDDMLVFGTSKKELAAAGKRIEEFLWGLRLKVHAGKSRVYRTRDGVSFLGWRVFRNRLRLQRGNVIRFRRRLRRLIEEYRSGAVRWRAVEIRVQGWIAHAEHGDTWRLRRRLFSETMIRTRSAISTPVFRIATTTNPRIATTTSGSGVCGM